MPKMTDEERRAKRNAYARAYSAKNREKRKAAWRAYYARNRESQLEKHREWRSIPENRAKEAEYARKYRRGFSPDFYKNRWLKEKSRRHTVAGRAKPAACDICGNTKDRIVFDHCHQYGHFRGWICHRCNVVLGLTEDGSDLLLKLVAYLHRTKTNSSPQLTLPGI